ncbi:MAG: hypothetical protein A2014_04985 [Spirochaetes bacterium GWF1_49_6]|nr:MAG: hypothetical protein A2014_04985 [Spirochaetes bacterium GWF1_49_6]
MRKRNLIIVALAVYLAGIILYLLFGYFIERSQVKAHDQSDMERWAKSLSIIADDSYFSSDDAYTLNGNPRILSNIIKMTSILDAQRILILVGTNNIYYYSFYSSVTNGTAGMRLIFNPPEGWYDSIANQGYYSIITNDASKKDGEYYYHLMDKDGRSVIAGIFYGEDHEIFSMGISLWLNALLTGVYFLLLSLPFMVIYIRSTHKEHEQLVQMMNTDQLTFLPSRTKLLMDLKKMQNPTVILVNVDSFKQINSLYGNKAGDFILIGVANRFKYLLPKGDYRIYRLHSDEFAVVSDKFFSLFELTTFIEFLITGIADKIFSYNRNEISISVTVGVAKASMLLEPDKEEIWQSLVTHAGMALNAARRNNLNFLIYDESSEYFSKPSDNVNWLNIIRSAIKDERIVPFCQPIYNNHTKKIEKYECLVRLIDESNGIVSPANFLDVAKKTRLLHQISHTMIEKSFAFFENLPYQFSVNLSFSDVKNNQLIEFVEGLLIAKPETAKRLVFEILESEGIGDFERIQAFVKKMKRYGVKIAIDDFGSGYSNYENILKLGVDYLKIDASLVKELPVSRHCSVLVHSIITFARQLGIETIAEFVYSEEVFKQVVELGIGYSQGYFIGKPAPIEDIT